MFTNATINQLQTALKTVNKSYNNNLIFNRIEQKTKNKVLFTLKIKNSKQNKGTRKGFYPTSKGNPKRLSCACWHAHGDFFDALFKISSDIYILARNKKITSYYGNWEDENIGSIMKPMYHSEACFCNVLLPHPILKPEFKFDK